MSDDFFAQAQAKNTRSNSIFPIEGKVYRRIETGSSGSMLHAAVSLDDSLLATCSTDSKIGIWNIQDSTQLRVLDAHVTEVTTCGFGEGLLATGSRDGVVILWRYKDGKSVARISVHHGAAVRGCPISQDGTMLATGAEDGQGRVFKIKSGAGEFIKGPESIDLIGHSDSINDVIFSNDGAYVLTASSDATAKIWDINTGKCLRTFKTGYGKLVNAKFSPDNSMVITLGRQVIGMYAVQQEKLCHEIYDKEGRGYQALASHPVSNSVCIASMDGTITIQSIQNFDAKLVKVSEHQGPILTCNFSPSGAYGITGGLDGNVLVWV